MTKKELNDAVVAAKADTRTALQIVYDALNQGQQKKLLDNENVKTLFDRYGVEVE